MDREQFKVDLRGIVDILSNHLYSSERVYLRELIQNASDAINARERYDPGFRSGAVQIDCTLEGGPMVLRDNGVGLTESEMHELMATVGGSSKRDDFSVTREKFLGQFGIGVLSAFLVADSIEVRSRSARQVDADTVLFSGHSDGTYTVARSDRALDEPGTEIRIFARPEHRHWCAKDTVTDIVRRVAGLMSLPISVDGNLHSGGQKPWEMSVEEQISWCREEFGFDAMGIVPLRASSQDVIGVCFVLPYAAAPGHRTGDRIYSRGLLVADSETQILPGWAFFARAVLDAGRLPLTASREQLQETATLTSVRDHLGYEILAELILVHDRAPAVYEDILRLHSSGMKALAVDNSDVRDLVRSTMLYQTSQGTRTLDELIDLGGEVPYVEDEERYLAMRDIAFYAGVLVVCAADPYDEDLLARVSETSEHASFRRVDDEAIFAFTKRADHANQPRADALASEASQVLAGEHLSVHVQEFGPKRRMALWWPATGSTHTAEVVLNARNPVVGALLREAIPTDERAPAIWVAYLVGMLQGRNQLTVEQAEQLALSSAALVSALDSSAPLAGLGHATA